MAFNTGLSGLRAASVDLDVTGNNIANASTVGFKGSKAQFGDLYASGFLSSGTNPIGDGVRVQDVKQSFGQGNISFTDNGLDMAINGDGFFVLNNGGEIRYSRAGQFGIDKDGFITNNQNMRVQGFTADADGNLSGVRGDLQVETDNLAPRRTTNLRSDLNLDSRQSVLENRIRDLGETLNVADLDGDVFQIQYSDGTTSQPITIGTGEPANEVAELLGSQSGVNASARTQFDLSGQFDITQLQTDLADPDFELTISLNGSDNVTFRGSDGITDLNTLAAAINNSELNTLRARVSDTGDDIEITDSRGFTVDMGYTTGAAGAQDFVDPQRGNLFVTTERDVSGIATAAGGTDAFATAYDSGETRITNEFNPLDQRTYNHATSTTIYDSLGNSHELTQFFVKEPAPGNGVGQSEWSVYLQIDGEMVAGTDEAPYTARFNQDGALQSINGDPNGEIVVTDWIPKDVNGLPNGSDGPPAAGEEVVTPIPEPPTTSAFVVDLGNTTQYGSAFGVNDQNQNGFTTGRLSGLDVSDQGILFARYTNGQSKELGQVALAAFNNTDGLTPVGDTTWVETFESGQPIIGAPDTGTLGSIKASSLEDSNVDLSAELVNLIIAQRNYQANAKTIETSDAVTQTIINLR
ncbi:MULTISPECIES: flagellar hook protein FlgE [Marinobacter]|uniref:flagellar hook protein FlgE n=1 Tax=Marinobacter TaxID=2742 RepID=UPI002006B666|nr:MULTISPECIES: flagellar hook protein FlgE [Marinobacter]MCK7551848.1 flagellar hook protein FlgE [Marinobacter goseongensis]MDV3503857.1 flagellar hook protein FlgE [Marinobacter sp. M-5]